MSISSSTGARPAKSFYQRVVLRPISSPSCVNEMAERPSARLHAVAHQFGIRPLQVYQTLTTAGKAPLPFVASQQSSLYLSSHTARQLPHLKRSIGHKLYWRVVYPVLDALLAGLAAVAEYRRQRRRDAFLLSEILDASSLL